MLAKLTSKNQLTLPKSITQAIGPIEYFEVQAVRGQIVLTPVRIQRSDALRAKLAELNLTESDIGEAMRWVRKSKAPVVGRSGSAASKDIDKAPVKARRKA